ncbi:tripartite tricarboxylate transporter permease [Pannonibacter sp.]|uniref:tripartite tricarboxylate transporter permease n=1 Tax=Pannonibacter sp. TaxID=1906786 RepID=UPI003F700514
MFADVLAAMAGAAAILSDPLVLFYIVLGAMLGGLMSVVPGIGGILGLALLLPFTFSLSPYEAVAFMLGAMAVLSTTDTIPAILFGVPGTATSMVTVLDGFPMAKRGEAGRALAAGLLSSVIGGALGALPLLVVIPLVMPFIMAMTSPELTAMCILGLSMVATLSGGSMLKGLAGAALGTLLAMVGADSQTATMRWTFDAIYLWDGINLLIVFLGIYAIPELADMAIQGKSIAKDADRSLSRSPLRGALQGCRDVGRNMGLVARSSGISTVLGVIPAIGATVIPWLVYSYTTMTTKGESQFGQGDVRGVIASESSNNATVGGSLLPTVALGVPGSAPMALLLAALMLHGIAPGPNMLTKNLDFTFMMVWTIVIANVVGGLFAFALCVPLSRIVFLRTTILVPIIASVVFIGAVQSARDWMDLAALLAVGLLGWFMKRARWPRAPFALAFILAPLIEQYFYISMRIYGWDWLLRPAVVVMLALTLVFLLFVAVRQYRDTRKVLQGKLTFVPAFTVETGVAVAAVACLAAALVTANDWPLAARAIPQIAAGFGLVMAVGVLVTGWMCFVPPATGDRVAAPKALHFDLTADYGDLSRLAILWRGLRYFVFLLGFGLLATCVGMIPAVPAFVLLYLIVHGERPMLALAVTAGVGGLSYALFDLFLRLPWPKPAYDLLSVIG